MVESISFPISADQVDALVALCRDQIKGILETFQRDRETFPDLRVSEAGGGGGVERETETEADLLSADKAETI